MKAFNIIFKEKLEQIKNNIKTIEFKRNTGYELKITLKDQLTIEYQKGVITIKNKEKITEYHDGFTIQGDNVENYIEFEKDKGIIQKIYQETIKDLTRHIAKKETKQEIIFKEIKNTKEYTAKEPIKILEELIK